jgi:hypothetical protein
MQRLSSDDGVIVAAALLPFWLVALIVGVAVALIVGA